MPLNTFGLDPKCTISIKTKLLIQIKMGRSSPIVRQCPITILSEYPEQEFSAMRIVALLWDPRGLPYNSSVTACQGLPPSILVCQGALWHQWTFLVRWAQ